MYFFLLFNTMQKTSLNTRSTGDFPGGSVVKSPLLPQQGAQVYSLAGGFPHVVKCSQIKQLKRKKKSNLQTYTKTQKFMC